MKRTTFIKTTATFAAGTAIVPLNSCKSEKKEALDQSTRKNWAGNYTYRAKNLYEPKTVEEVQALVKKLNVQKALGSRHCFNHIADSPRSQISTKFLDQAIAIDKEAKTVTVGAGAKYGDFSPELHNKGYALHNLASLPHISVAGACATATHGSGVKNGNLATSVTAMELVSGEGDIVQLSREQNADIFNGMVVHLGALGVITKITLAIQETYDVQQDVFLNLPLQSLIDNFDAILSSGYSVSLFTDWQNQVISQIWIKRRTDGELKALGNDFYGARAAERDLHPITELSAENCTEQMGVPGPWYERLPHFKMGFTPSSGEELQSEFFVSREHALEAILAIEKKRDQLRPHLMITEIRSVAADNLWMSPCYQQDCIAIHFTWKQHVEEVGRLLPVLEEVLAPFNVRPHWGKIFSMAPSILKSSYEKLPDFLGLIKKYDPKRKFENDYLNQHIYPS